ncbi:MAG TPA: hypothetical protein DCL61_00200 [Cyanobacteria bacterium UBA12227]|nr:hypothetical protein [Cyanobacteria bacterium UBA12227]HAX87484.1 hypothetical protein [Cyanobacteria bacterium UBA11370]HBY78258.1 hypothetical protein [Cyanobacteria bacterium UBA11148]
MKRTIKSVVALSALAATAIAPILLSANSASARPEGTDANYIGAGVAAGVTNGGQDGDAATFGGNIQGRITTSKAPVSLRGAVLFSDDNSAIMPIVTYDVPVTNNANIYVGAGYSFVETEGQPTPLGNSNAPVVTVGAEAQFGQNVVVYGDTKIGIEAYENSSASAVSFQGGAGIRF